MLSAWFSGKGFNMTPDDDGCYFIDRDGTYFHYIIYYLRSGEIHLPDDDGTLSLLLKEVDFYQLKELRNAIHEQLEGSFPGSNILSQQRAWCDQLEKWIGSRKKWSITFNSREAQDSNLAASCLNSCAGKGELLLVIKTSSGNVIGGYTRVGFNVHDARRGASNIHDAAAFLFRLSGSPHWCACQQPSQALQSNNGSSICFGQNALLIQGTIVYSQQSGVYAINTPLLGNSSQEQIVELEAFCTTSK